MTDRPFSMREARLILQSAADLVDRRGEIAWPWLDFAEEEYARAKAEAKRRAAIGSEGDRVRRLIQEDMMSEPATFDEEDFAALTTTDKKALRGFQRAGLGFEPLAKAPGVGQKSMDSLIRSKLAEEGPASIHGRTFQLTDKGWLACEWLNGNKMRVTPPRSAQ